MLLAVGHACVDIYQGAVAALIPFFVAERDYTYAVASGIVLAASLLSSVAQPVFGLLTDRWAMPWLLPVSTLLGGVGIALSGLSGSYGLTLFFVAVSGIGVAAYHPESARVARQASQGSHHGSLHWTPVLVLPALAGAALCVPVLRMLARPQTGTAKTRVPRSADDVASFVKLSCAVVFRSVVFTGLSTFISLYAQQRMQGSSTAGTVALFLLFLGGAVGSVLGGSLANRYDRVRVSRWSYLLSIAAVTGVIYTPGPAMFLFVALTSAGLYVPFSLQVTLGQDYLPSRIGTASGITLGLTVSIGGLISPLLGHLADTTTLQTALTPLIAMPALSWLLFRVLPEPTTPKPQAAAPMPASARQDA
ncbi:MFS transporter [Streptomyces spiralis]|uniref:MFS transporter n=1 Tax=Streptomyces spiralis TaxID=66376 RepID=A0A919AQV5_9ACTN|nr:MFS transporter [Streptomyces spiralis]